MEKIEAEIKENIQKIFKFSSEKEYGNCNNFIFRNKEGILRNNNNTNWRCKWEWAIFKWFIH